MTSESRSIDEFLNSARQSLQFGMYELALHGFEQAIALDSESTDAWRGKAEVLRKLGRYGEAIEADEKAIALQMNFVSLDAEFWSQKGDYHGAWYNRGNSLAALGRYEESITSYDKALQIKPDYPEAWNNRGALLYVLGQYEAAIVSCDKALEVKLDHPEAWNNRGNALLSLGQCETAIISFNKALEIKPDFHGAWYNRGNALGDLERYEEAIASYDEALRHKPNHEVWYNRGIVLKKLGQYETAIISFNKALQIKPDFYGAWQNRGDSLNKLGQYDAAIASYDKALEIKPDFHEAWYNRGTTLGNLGQYDAAIASCDKALEIKPDFHEAWYNRGISLRNLGQYEAAISSYDKALEIKPDFHAAWDNRGISLFSLGKYKAAIANYDQGLTYVLKESDPEGWGILHHGKGDIYFYQAQGNQNIQAAKTYYRQAITTYNTASQTLESFPKSYLKLIQDLIKAHLGLSNPETANQWRITGLEVFRQLLNAQPTPFQKRKLEAEFSGFSQVDVDSLVSQGETLIALETAERYKNRCLTWILDEWKEQVISPSHAEIRQLLNPQTAIIYWHFSDDSLTTFILTPDSEDPILLDRSLQYDRAKNLQSWIENWNTQYNDYRTKKNNQSDHPWRRTLTTQLAKLKEILEISAIESHLSNIQALILIPHRDLHRFPIHALFSDTFAVSYLPSAQIGITQRSNPSDRTPFLLNIEDPDRGDPMPFAQLESVILNAIFAPNTVSIPSETSDRATVETALKTHRGIFHFTGHGTYNDRHPEHSELALQGTDTLTAKEIRHFNLKPYHLVSLSACETALTGTPSIETEYVGLTSAFLQAGVSHVISTLWTVEEASNAYFMIRFYQNWLDGQSSITALQFAQTWLRTASYADFCQWLKALLPKVSHHRGAQEYLQGCIQSIEGKIGETEPPYCDPYYWAAFTHTGL